MLVLALVPYMDSVRGARQALFTSWFDPTASARFTTRASFAPYEWEHRMLQAR